MCLCNVSREGTLRPPWAAVPELGHPERKQTLPHVELKLLVFYFTATAPHSDAGHHWKRAWHHPLTPTWDIFISTDELFQPSVLQNKQAQLSQSLQGIYTKKYKHRNIFTKENQSFPGSWRVLGRARSGWGGQQAGAWGRAHRAVRGWGKAHRAARPFPVLLPLSSPVPPSLLPSFPSPRSRPWVPQFRGRAPHVWEPCDSRTGWARAGGQPPIPSTISPSSSPDPHLRSPSNPALSCPRSSPACWALCTAAATSASPAMATPCSAPWATGSPCSTSRSESGEGRGGPGAASAGVSGGIKLWGRFGTRSVRLTRMLGLLKYPGNRLL